MSGLASGTRKPPPPAKGQWASSTPVAQSGDDCLEPVPRGGIDAAAMPPDMLPRIVPAETVRSRANSLGCALEFCPPPGDR